MAIEVSSKHTILERDVLEPYFLCMTVSDEGRDTGKQLAKERKSAYRESGENLPNVLSFTVCCVWRNKKAHITKKLLGLHKAVSTL